MLHLWVERLPSPIGEIVLLTDEQDRLRALDWVDQETRMRQLLRLHYGANGVALNNGRASPSHALSAMADYLAGALDAIEDVVIATNGTGFQRAVWAALRRIPAGDTSTYGELSRRVDRPRAVRAVGQANGANPVSIVVPCHRVIGADASLTGYGGGLERKRWLLRHEGVTLRLRNDQPALTMSASEKSGHERS
jgi:methylated-DNA-[protein]-cysteine S-methyltransferase